MKISYRNPWLLGAIVLVIGAGAWWWRQAHSQTSTVQPSTAAVEKGTLVQSVSGSGSLTARIQADITAPTYGTVQRLFVKNGDEVTANQSLLQLHSLATNADKAKALASLLAAQDTLNQTRTKATTLAQAVTTAQQLAQDAQKNEAIATTTVTSSQLALAKSKVDAKKSLTDAEKSVIDAANTQSKASTDLDVSAAQTGQTSAGLGLEATKIGNQQTVTNTQKTYQEAQRDAASAKLKTQSAQLGLAAAQQNFSNQQGSLAAASASLTASRLSYQMLTDQTVTSPVTGRVVNLALAEGATVGSGNNNSSSSSSSSNTTSTNSSKLFSIIDFKSLRAVISVSEVDVATIKLSQPATLTFDALPDKTFTGTVSNIDTVGTTTSGVTTYNVEITLDALGPDLKPGMTVSASIITSQKNNVLLVPSSAVQNQNGQSTVEVIRNGSPQTVSVTVGDSNDTQTEITAGIQAGEMVITNPSTGTTTAGGSSVFSNANRRTFGGFGGGRPGG